MSTTVLFPGQGAAAPGAGRPWVDHAAWSVVTEAEEILDRPLARLLLDADAGELASTRASQLAVLLTSLVVWEAFAPRLVEPPAAFAGHSLGQITALIAAGVLSRADGLRLALARADASQASADANPGTMVALIGTDVTVAEAVCAAVPDAWVANDNAPGQVVVAGTPAAMVEVTAQARSFGVRRVTPLAVGHAFHTPLLADAAAALRPTLDALTWHRPTQTIVTNDDAKQCREAGGWPDRLQRHLVERVRWRESVLVCTELGTQVFIEIGPGAVLGGLIRRTVTAVTLRSVATPDELCVLGSAPTGTAMAAVSTTPAASETLR